MAEISNVPELDVITDDPLIAVKSAVVPSIVQYKVVVSGTKVVVIVYVLARPSSSIVAGPVKLYVGALREVSLTPKSNVVTTGPDILPVRMLIVNNSGSGVSVILSAIALISKVLESPTKLENPGTVPLTAVKSAVVPLIVQYNVPTTLVVLIVYVLARPSSSMVAGPVT